MKWKKWSVVALIGSIGTGLGFILTPKSRKKIKETYLKAKDKLDVYICKLSKKEESAKNKETTEASSN